MVGGFSSWLHVSVLPGNPHAFKAVRQRQCRFREAVDACHLGQTTGIFFSSAAWCHDVERRGGNAFFRCQNGGQQKKCQIVNQIVAIGRCCHVDLLGKNSEQDLSAFSNSMII